MSRKKYTAEKIITILREVELLSNQGKPIKEISRKLGITEQTYYRWRKDYGGLRLDQAKRLKDLQKENARLKKLLAERSLDIEILKETIEGNY